MGPMRQISRSVYAEPLDLVLTTPGLGVSVTILDDGIEKDHPDLIRYISAMSNIAIFLYLIQTFPICKKKIFQNYFCRNYDPLSSTDVNDNDRYVTMWTFQFRVVSFFIEKTEKNSNRHKKTKKHNFSLSSDPNPRYDFSDSNRHGTRCAGQVFIFSSSMKAHQIMEMKSLQLHCLLLCHHY